MIFGGWPPHRESAGYVSPPKLLDPLIEILAFTCDTFARNKVPFALTALTMVVGTASLILVVTIGSTGKEYVLRQIADFGG